MSPLNFPPSSPWRGAPSVPAQWPSCACPCLCTEELLTRQACVEDSMHLGSTCSTLRKGCPELISLWMSCRCLHRADMTPLGSTEHRAPVTSLHISIFSWIIAMWEDLSSKLSVTEWVSRGQPHGDSEVTLVPTPFFSLCTGPWCSKSSPHSV